MSWSEDLRPASFRGVGFYVDGVEVETGRRIQLHDYPLRDTHATEDLGGKARRYQFRAYVLGAGYIDAMRALRDACEIEGPGELVHPSLGAVQVRCEGLNIAESAKEGGVARLELRFVEAGLALSPVASADRKSSVLRSVVRFRGQVLAEFSAAIDFRGLQAFAREEFVALVSDFGHRFHGLMGDLQLTAQVSQTVLDVAAHVEADIRLLTEKAEDMVDDIPVLGRHLVGLIDRAGDLAAHRALDFIEGLVRYVAPFQASAVGTQAVKNSEAAEHFIRALAVSKRAEIAAVGVYDSYDDAIVAREGVLADADNLAEYVSAQGYADLVRLRSDLVAALPAAQERLPRVSYIEVPSPLPSVVLAYQLYDDVAREEALVRRNKLRHPGCIGGADKVEVLFDA